MEQVVGHRSPGTKLTEGPRSLPPRPSPSSSLQRAAIAALPEGLADMQGVLQGLSKSLRLASHHISRGQASPSASPAATRSLVAVNETDAMATPPPQQPPSKSPTRAEENRTVSELQALASS